MEVEGIVLNEVSKPDGKNEHNHHMISYVCSTYEAKEMHKQKREKLIVTE